MTMKQLNLLRFLVALGLNSLCWSSPVTVTPNSIYEVELSQPFVTPVRMDIHIYTTQPWRDDLDLWLEFQGELIDMDEGDMQYGTRIRRTGLGVSNIDWSSPVVVGLVNLGNVLVVFDTDYLVVHWDRVVTGSYRSSGGTGISLIGSPVDPPPVDIISDSIVQPLALPPFEGTSTPLGSVPEPSSLLLTVIGLTLVSKYHIIKT